MEEIRGTGACRCGAVEIEISAPPLLTMACHCRGCQRMSASAYSLSAMFAASDFRVVSGTPVRGGLRGPQLAHFFCPDCMTWMFTRIAGMEEIVNIRPTMFDDPRLAEPFMETMTAAKLPWATTPARRSYAGFPAPEELPGLFAAFAAEWARDEGLPASSAGPR